jgi:O-antigen ligase
MDTIFLTGAAGILFILLVLVYKKNLLLGFVIITLVTITRDTLPNLRTFFQVLDFCILAYLFLKEYGFDFGKYPRVPPIMVKFFILLYTALIVSTILSEYPPAGIYFITRTTIFFLVVYVFYSLIKTREQILTGLMSIFLAGVILVSSIIFDFLKEGGDFLNAAGTARIRDFGLYSNFNTTAAYFIIAFPLILISMHLSKKKIHRVLLSLIMLYFIFGIVLISSRAAIVGTIISSLIILFFINRKLFYSISITFGLIVLAFLFIKPLYDFAGLFLRVEEGLSQRDIFWNLAFNIIRDHPIFGIGPGAYKFEEFNYMPILLNSWMGGVMVNLHEITDGHNNSHSFYFVFFSDMGILGLITALSLPVIFFKVAISSFKRFTLNEEYKMIILAIFASGVSMFVRAGIESIGILSYGFLSNDLPFWLFFCILIRFYMNEIKESDKQVTELNPATAR